MAHVCELGFRIFEVGLFDALLGMLGRSEGVFDEVVVGLAVGAFDEADADDVAQPSADGWLVIRGPVYGCSYHDR